MELDEQLKLKRELELTMELPLNRLQKTRK
jgi:hypothetical protein